MDSTIRLRQLNQAELSGFVSGILNSLYKNPTGNIIPSISGTYDLGSPSFPYSHLYANQVSVNSGSGINFGNTNFTAYSSGGNAYINVGGVVISSTGEGILIAGPSGATGPSGARGVTGATGIGVTGISYNSTSSILTFNLSNNTQTSFSFVGLTGDKGTSLTGFFRSGNLIFPQFDHGKGTGNPIQLVAGPTGPMGGITLSFEKQGFDWMPNGYFFPASTIIDPYYISTPVPNINLTRGMNYNANASGLHTYTLTAEDISLFNSIITGVSPSFSAGDQVNYIKTGENTGYWRFSFFPSGTPTGYYEGNPPFDESTNNEVFGSSFSISPYRDILSFTPNFNAQSNYRYGFMAYTLTDDPAFDTSLQNTGYAWVLGDAFITDSVGAVGPIGPTGQQGLQGNQGDIGPQGDKGDDGNSVVSYQQQQVGVNQYQVQFQFSDGSLGPWIALPSGGPSGVQGAVGPTGNLINSWSGQYNTGNIYQQYSIVSNTGSTYIYTGVGTISGVDPSDTTKWQILAQAGAIGPSGASGVADRYSSSFFVQSGFPTGAGTFSTGITGITVNGSSLSGTGARFSNNQIVSFKNSGLRGYSFTPYQSIVLSTNSFTGTYCYATVNSYDTNNGILSFTPTGGTGIANSTISGGSFLWYNWNNATINLGANVMSGATGPQGPVGPQGAPGSAQAMRSWTGYAKSGDHITFNPTGINITGGIGIDMFNLTITGDGTEYFGGDSVYLDFNFAGFQTGQALIVKIRNVGIPNGNDNVPLFYWSGTGVINAGAIKWPNGQYSRPDGGQGYIYTILRCPDEFGSLACYGTYSNPYF